MFVLDIRTEDWRTLGMLALFAGIAAALAWWVAGHYFAASGPFFRIAAGATLIALSYGFLIHVFLGWGRGWYTAARNAGHRA